MRTKRSDIKKGEEISKKRRGKERRQRTVRSEVRKRNETAKERRKKKRCWLGK